MAANLYSESHSLPCPNCNRRVPLADLGVFLNATVVDVHENLPNNSVKCECGKVIHLVVEAVATERGDVIVTKLSRA